MAKAVRHAIGPLYLALCLILGGSAQGVWANALLQLAGLALIGWAAATGIDRPLTRRARGFYWILIAALAWVAVQLVPLPAGLWPSLGGRERIAHDFAILGLAIPATPLSLAPYSSVAALVALIPAIAIFCVMTRLHAFRSPWLALALIGATLAGILLGALQAANTETSSAWYLYAESSFGVATGFFANANHMAILMVICIPFLAALLATVRRRQPRRFPAVLMLSLGIAVLLAAGILLNKSIAGYALAIPVIAASSLLLLPRRTALRWWIILGSAVLALAALVAISLSPTGRGLGGQASVSSRAEMLQVTSRAADDFFPFGSGLGTFQQVYQLYEDHDRVTPTHVNHAHDDYAELVLELGIPGALLIVAFLACWLLAARAVWKKPGSSDFAKAGTIATAAILVHSIVDFPLRTAAISACFAASLALMVQKRRKSRRDESDLRPARHVVVE